jgi:hypothetical protein
MVELLHLTDAEYFAIPNRFHASSTANLLQSPARYAAAEYEQTDSKDLGSYIHGLMSGDLARFSIGPDLSQCKTADGKPTTSTSAKSVQAAVEAFYRDNPGVIVLSAKDQITGPKCAASLKSAEAAEGLEVLHREVCILWDDKQGRPCILKADAIAICNGVLVCLDYKSHGKPLSAKSLGNAAVDYCYPSQGAHYLDGIAAAQKAGLLPDLPAEFRIAWVSTAAPHDAWVQDVDGEALEIGAADLEIAKARWWAGVQSGIWPTAGDLGLLPRKMTLPKWKRMTTEEEF